MIGDVGLGFSPDFRQGQSVSIEGMKETGAQHTRPQAAAANKHEALSPPIPDGWWGAMVFLTHSVRCFWLRGVWGCLCPFPVLPVPRAGLLAVCSIASVRCNFCDPRECSLLGPSVGGILQARILEWVAMPSSGLLAIGDKLRA